MADPINSPEPGPISRSTPRAAPPLVGDTESLVRETWRHYYVAQLASAQFGPASLEASIARSHALTSYQQLQGSLRNFESYYRRVIHSPDAPTATRPRHLKLVRDEPAEPEASTGNTET